MERYLEDNQIIDLYWNRDETAITESDRKYGAYCTTVAKNIIGNYEDVEECVNDTWMKSWGSIPPTRPSVLKMYFAKIVRNLAINRYRAESAQKRGNGQVDMVLEELEECIEDNFSVEGQVLASELGSLINAFVRDLPERDGNVFLRRYFFMEEIADIASKYELTVNNTNVILNRVRKKLKIYLAERGYAVS